MAEEKKTQIGTTPGRTVRPTGSPPIASALGTKPASASGTPAPVDAAAVTDPPVNPKAKTSYLAETPDPLLGSTVAERYKIIRKLGEGGMGAVYLALHMVLEKQVALKVLHGEFARKPDLVERFMQEAKAASRIRHENVIDISDFGATPDGLVFFAMELLNGHDLHDEISRAKLGGNLLPWSRTKKIFLQVCSALSAAHSRGIIHRDLKPENIYLVDFLGDPDFVKLLDFGIAKLTDVSGAGDENARKLTKTGMLFGTPEYMSPEQARGEKVDHRVDIYAMGCILFQLLTNQVPFTSDNFMGVLAQHLTAEPPQISPQVLDRIGAPRAIADIIDKALTKDPNTRWQTIDEMGNAIREACGDAPIADRSGKMRAASVPSPGETTRLRPPTGPTPAMRARTPSSSGQLEAATAVTQSPGTTSLRSKTAWTGNLSVPEEAPDAPPPAKSKLPLIIGALVLVGGGIAAAVILTGKKDSAGTGQGSAVATGSADVAPTPTPTPTPPPTPEPALPAMVTIKLDSTPRGALVVDAANSSVTYGKTPATFTVPGSKDPRQFKFVLKNHGDATVELIPNRETIEFTQTLTKGATAAVVTKVPDPALKTGIPVGGGTPAGSGSGAMTTTKPDPAVTTKPDPATTTKPDPAITTKPDPTTTKPDDTAPKPDPGAGSGSAKKQPDCPDDEVPCLKTFP